MYLSALTAAHKRGIMGLLRGPERKSIPHLTRLEIGAQPTWMLCKSKIVKIASIARVCWPFLKQIAYYTLGVLSIKTLVTAEFSVSF